MKREARACKGDASHALCRREKGTGLAAKKEAFTSAKWEGQSLRGGVHHPPYF